jgi:hypothetical protein
MVFSIMTENSSLTTPKTVDAFAAAEKSVSTASAGSEGGPRSVFATTPFDGSKDERDADTRSEVAAKSFAVIPGR